MWLLYTSSSVMGRNEPGGFENNYPCHNPVSGGLNGFGWLCGTVMDILISPFLKSLLLFLLHFYLDLLRTLFALEFNCSWAFHVEYIFLFPYLAKECWEHSIFGKLYLSALQHWPSFQRIVWSRILLEYYMSIGKTCLWTTYEFPSILLQYSYLKSMSLSIVYCWV